MYPASSQGSFHATGTILPHLGFLVTLTCRTGAQRPVGMSCRIGVDEKKRWGSLFPHRWGAGRGTQVDLLGAGGGCGFHQARELVFKHPLVLR